MNVLSLNGRSVIRSVNELGKHGNISINKWIADDYACAPLSYMFIF